VTGPEPGVGPIGVVGAGTMGLGIAAVAALAGFDAVVLDPSAEVRELTPGRVGAILDRGSGRRWTAEEARAAAGRVQAVGAASDLRACGLIVEAVPEDLELKRRIFAELAAAVDPEAVLATNTSSLSIESIAGAVPDPSRFLGLHFFNPATAMELVEVVVGARTAPAAVELAAATVAAWGKTPIRVADGIGFLANRCARPYTLEGLRLSAALGIEPARVDLICRLGGFPMGPFELIDLVGADVSLGVAESFYRQSFGEPRWRPHRTLVQAVAAGRLGRKTGEGFYVYDGSAHHAPDPDGGGPELLVDGERLASLAGPEAPEVLGWIAAALVNEAAFALEEGIAAAADVDLAMRLGYRWPLGPLAIGRKLGFAAVYERLEAMRETYGEAYRPAPRLRQLGYAVVSADGGSARRPPATAS
jgi:3-hydroxybutyryl-CoA dehydrogenase